MKTFSKLGLVALLVAQVALSSGCSSTRKKISSAADVYPQVYNDVENANRMPSTSDRPETGYCETLKRPLKRGEECIAANEDAHYKSLGKRLGAVQMELPHLKENLLKTDDVGGGIRRTFHAKAHACVKAFVEPLPNRDRQTYAGLFSDDSNHPAWIRFSNAKGIVAPDKDHDARGMAVKVMGVAGARLSENEKQTQDFLVTNKPRGTARTAEDFVEFAEANGKVEPLARYEALTAFFVPHRLGEARELMRVSSKVIDSVAKETYWSGGPFLWGLEEGGTARAVKFKIEPCREKDGTLAPALSGDIRAKSPEEDYLKSDLVRLLAKHELCFQMSVQIQKDPVKQPIEDGFEEWKESETPALPVARIKIPRQKFDTSEQNEFCEHLTFNPWHGLKDHRPLGDLNRARRQVYPATQTNRLSVQPATLQFPNVDANNPEPYPGDKYWLINPL
jgi:catalase